MKVEHNNILETSVGVFLVVFLLILCFSGVYQPEVLVYKFNTSIFTLILSLVCAVAFIVSTKREVLYDFVFFNRYLVFYFVLLLLALSVSSFRYFIYGVGDRLFIDTQVKQVILYLVSTLGYSICLLLFLIQINKSTAILGVALFIAFIILLFSFQLTSYNFKVSVIEFSALDQYWKDFAISTNRGIGLQGLSIWDSSISYALLYFLIVPIWNKNGLKAYTIFYTIFFSLILITLLTGRTGLLLLVYVHLLVGLYYKKFTEIFILSLMIVFIGSFLYQFSNSVLVRQIIDFSFELFINLFSGSMSTGSTDDLINNHLFLPTVDSFLIGDNTYLGDGDLNDTIVDRSSDSTFVIYYKAFVLLGMSFTVGMISLVSCHFRLILSKLFDLRTRVVSIAVTIFVLLLFVKVPIHVSTTLLKTISFVSTFIY